MPAKLDRCVAKLKAEGKTESQAFAICQSAIKLSQAVKEGRLKIRTIDPAPVKLQGHFMEIT